MRLKKYKPFMMTQIREPMHLSTNSNGNNVEGLVAVELAISLKLLQH